MRALAALSALVLALGFASCGADLPPREAAERLSPVAGWPTIPAGLPFGQVSAVDVDSHNHVFVLQRAARAWEEPFPKDAIKDNTVLMFDGESGKLLAKWGAGAFIMPHGLSVDGQDRVWITDVANEQVYRYSHDGELELTLGEKSVSAEDKTHFGRPSDVAFDGDRVLVSDGYVNARVISFDQQGNYLGEWGGHGEGDGEFNLPHCLSNDGGKISVADRENARVQIFTDAGKFAGKRAAPNASHPYCVKPLGNGWSIVAEGRDAYDRKGAILRIYGPDGNLRKTYDAGEGDANPRFSHDIALGPDGALYMADVDGGKVLKYNLDLGHIEKDAVK